MSSLLSYALTSVADVKESMGIQSSDLTWDNLITRKINQATRQIEAYCGRRFLSTIYTQEEYNSSQTSNLILKQRPVIGSVTLEVRDSALNISDWETVDSQLYFVDNNSGVMDLLFNAVGKWNRWRVTYTAGYASIPEDLAEACATLSAYYALNADASYIGKQEVREGSRMVRYLNDALTFKKLMQNLGVDEIIDSYANSPVLADR